MNVLYIGIFFEVCFTYLALAGNLKHNVVEDSLMYLDLSEYNPGGIYKKLNKYVISLVFLHHLSLEWIWSLRLRLAFDMHVRFLQQINLARYCIPSVLCF